MPLAGPPSLQYARSATRSLISAEVSGRKSEGRAVTPAQKSPRPAFRLGKGAALTDAQVKVWAELKEETHTDPKQQSPLTAAQVKVLAEGIKNRWGPPPSPAESVPPYIAPAGAGAGKKDEGIRVFARACAGCHGSQGRGGSLMPGIGAINTPDFLALVSDQALRRYAITGRPDLGMPPYDGKDGRPPDFQSLTSEEIDSLVALLACWRQGGRADGK